YTALKSITVPSGAFLSPNGIMTKARRADVISSSPSPFRAAACPRPRSDWRGAAPMFFPHFHLCYPPSHSLPIRDALVSVELLDSLGLNFGTAKAVKAFASQLSIVAHIAE